MAATKPRFFPTPSAFREWLLKHHATESELLVGFYKKGTAKPSITWPESVDQALCFGWIDGVRRSIDDAAYTIRFTPRKKTSIWSAVNVARVAELTKLGLMQKAGLAAFALRTAARTGVYSHERNAAAKLSAAEEKVLRANEKARAYFEAQAPWYRRSATHWVISAKREETRAKRFARLVADCESERRIKPLTPPKKRA